MRFMFAFALVMATSAVAAAEEIPCDVAEAELAKAAKVMMTTGIEAGGIDARTMSRYEIAAGRHFACVEQARKNNPDMVDQWLLVIAPGKAVVAAEGQAPPQK